PRTLPADLASTAIGVCQVSGGRPQVIYDAAHDALLTELLLERFAAPSTFGRSEVRFRTLPGELLRTGAHGRLLTGEQSNTSLVFGEDYILKTFRRLWPGPNPDLELNMALSGSPYVARPCGWIEADLPGAPTPTTLAMLQTFIPNATDGWVLATADVGALLDGFGKGGESAFVEDAAQLGRTTAEVHRSLTRTLPTDELSPSGTAELADAMDERRATASAEAPAQAEPAPHHAPLLVSPCRYCPRTRPWCWLPTPTSPASPTHCPSNEYTAATTWGRSSAPAPSGSCSPSRGNPPSRSRTDSNWPAHSGT